MTQHRADTMVEGDVERREGGRLVINFSLVLVFNVFLGLRAFSLCKGFGEKARASAIRYYSRE